MSFSANVLRYGSDEPLPQAVRLWAGPLSLIYQAGDIRFVTLGRREVVRRIYVAVRDRNWGTVPAKLSEVCILRAEDRFDISFRARHSQGEIDFIWEGRIIGRPDGTITFSMDGEALSSFWRNRIGLCVLYPLCVAGQECTVQHVDGSEERGHFPRYIAPHQPFKQVRAISHGVGGQAKATVRLEGDIFEMEDQRNWSDASFKVYSTPLSLPFPVHVERNTRIRQEASITLQGATGMATRPRQRKRPIAIRVSDRSFPLPALGLSIPDHGERLSSRETERLRRLDLDYVLLELDLRDDSAQDRLYRAWQEADALGTRLRVALVLTERAGEELALLRASLAKYRPSVAAWFVYEAERPATSARLATSVREVLSGYDPQAPIGGGTRANFAELNRNRPRRGSLDILSYAITPQVHAYDNLSIVENLAGQPATVRSARRFAAGRPIAINSVTLKPRFNPVATTKEISRGEESLPPDVDARQMSLFCAAWTVGSLKHLASVGVESITYYETTGWRGIMEREEIRPHPAFHSTPGMVFPVYHILAAIAEFSPSEALATISGDPLRAEALALRRGELVRVIVANLSPEPQPVIVNGMRQAAPLWCLDENSAWAAMQEGVVPSCEGALSIGEERVQTVLAPYASLVLDGLAI